MNVRAYHSSGYSAGLWVNRWTMVGEDGIGCVVDVAAEEVIEREYFDAL